MVRVIKYKIKEGKLLIPCPYKKDEPKVYFVGSRSCNKCNFCIWHNFKKQEVFCSHH